MIKQKELMRDKSFMDGLGKNLALLSISIGTFFDLIVNNRRVIMENETPEAIFLFSSILIPAFITITILVIIKNFERISLAICQTIALLSAASGVLALMFIHVNPLIPADEEFVSFFGCYFRKFTIYNGFLFGSVFALFATTLQASIQYLKDNFPERERAIIYLRVISVSAFYIIISHVMMLRGWLLHLILFVPVVLLITVTPGRFFSIIYLFRLKKDLSDRHSMTIHKKSSKIIKATSTTIMMVNTALFIMLMTLGSTMQIPEFSLYLDLVNIDLNFLGMAILLELILYLSRKVNDPTRSEGLLIIILSSILIAATIMTRLILIDFSLEKESITASFTWGCIIAISLLIHLVTQCRIAYLKNKFLKATIAYLNWLIFCTGAVLGYAISYANAKPENIINLLPIPIFFCALCLVLELIQFLLTRHSRNMQKHEEVEVNAEQDH
ncbi:MAG: hypothetical protein ACTSWN_17125 [Promethearchaeota archaeon]